MWVISSTAEALQPTAIALGNFDGVHLGHRHAIAPIAEVPPPLHPTVLTFSPHPQEFFTGRSKELLTPREEKVEQLQQLGIEQLILLPFDRQLSLLSPADFVRQILVEQLQAQRISIGADFRFGHRRAGTAEDLQKLAAPFGVKVAIASLQNSDDANPDRISSSAIRRALQARQLDRANQLLGRPYSLVGTVVTGKQLGRTLGFPTANLKLPERKLLPSYGVYAVEIGLPNGDRAIGVTNIGYRPTADNIPTPTVEVHLFDWSGDLYDRTLKVNLLHFLRPERKFDSLDALKAQIDTDCQVARQYLQ